MTLRSQTGSTLVEVLIVSALLAGIAGAALYLFTAANDLSESTQNSGQALVRLDRAVSTSSRILRRGSMGTLRKLDGTEFLEGETDNGFSIDTVTDFGPNATPIRANVAIEWVLPTGATRGSVMRREGTAETTVVSGVSDYRITRQGRRLVLRVTAESGPTDDRMRTAQTMVRIAPRNN